MKRSKIVVIGAGSFFFGRPVIWNMLNSPALREGTLALVDTEADVLATMMNLGRPAMEATGGPTEHIASTDRADGGLVNPLYLAGDFAAHLDPVRLESPIRKGQFEDYDGNGLPHYAGAVDYEMSVVLGALGAEDPVIELEFNVPFRGVLELSFNGCSWHCLPWSPYRTSVPREELCHGGDDLRLRVYTSLTGAFDGQHAPPGRSPDETEE